MANTIYTSMMKAICDRATKCTVCGDNCVIDGANTCALCAYQSKIRLLSTFVPTSTRVKTPQELEKEAEDTAAGIPPVPCQGTCGELVRGKWDYCSACVKSVIAPWNVDITPVFGPVHISNAKIASDLQALEKYNIKRVVTIGFAKDVVVQQHPGIEYHRFELADDHTADIRSIFDEAFELTKLPGNTLIHCKAGVSRSASVVVAYLMTFGASYKLAYSYLNALRPILHINAGFHKVLVAFGEELAAKKQEHHRILNRLGVSPMSNEDIDALTDYYIANH